MSSMFLTFSVSAATTALSAPSSTISPSFCSATVWVSFIFLVRSFSASSLRAASSAGPWLARLVLCADSCRLAARRGMSRPLRSTMVPPSRPSISPAPALMTIAMPAMTAKAAKRLPLTPKLKPLCPGLLILMAICPPPRLRYLGMFPRAAVSWYPVNKFGKLGRFSRFFGARPVNLTEFSANRKSRQSKKAGVTAGLPQSRIERRSVARNHRAAEVEAIIDADLEGVFVEAEVAERHQRPRAREAGAAEIVIHVFPLGRPVRGEHVFEAGADGIAVAMVAIEDEGDRDAGECQGFAVVGIGVTAFDIDQPRTPGVAEAAGDRAESRADCCCRRSRQGRPR